MPKERKTVYNKFMNIIYEHLNVWNEKVLPILSILTLLILVTLTATLIKSLLKIQQQSHLLFPRIQKDVSVLQQMNENIQADLRNKTELFKTLLRLFSAYVFLKFTWGTYQHPTSGKKSLSKAVSQGFQASRRIYKPKSF